MSLDPAKAARFGGSKVRTGCLTCVKRHLKCDEIYQSSLDGTHQTCQRCLKAKRSCQQRLQGTSTSAQLRIVHYRSTISRSPQAWPAEDSLELRCVEYFKVRTAQELAGVHNPELWSHLVMQAAAAEPAIWSATVALGALHERFETNMLLSSGNKALEYPMLHYGRAIKLLCESIRTGSAASQDTPLLACALFSAFESMGCHLHSALSHVTSGLKVIGEAKVKENWAHAYTIRSHNSRTSLRLLFPLFTRLDTQRLELGDASFPAHQPLTIRRWKNMFANLNDFHDVRYQFDNVLNDLLHHIKHIQAQKIFTTARSMDGHGGTTAAFSYSINSFLHWASSFDKLLGTSKPDHDIPSCLLLQTWRLLISVMLRYDPEEGELGFDRFHSEFELMINLSAEYVCWSMELIGPSTLLLCETIPNPLNDKLPDTFGERHTAQANQELSYIGFMGVHFPAHHKPDILREATLAIHTGQYLLQSSHGSRASRKNWSLLSDCKQADVKSRFTFSHGVIYPLYVAISRCRDPIIRRRAWNLMHRCHRREGLWDSSRVARLGQRLIQIEEAKALHIMGYSEEEIASSPELKIYTSSQIPNCARISLLKRTPFPDETSIERYYMGRAENFSNPDSVEEVQVEETLNDSVHCNC